MNQRDNDHVTLHELRGFMADDLRGALSEAHAVSKATQCKQFMFSLSLNPPKDQTVSIDALLEAVERAERTLGLTGQPRAVVIHEKNGRRHAHAVWSRIDAKELKAVNMAFFKSHLKDLSHALYLDHGWELPEGHRENGWKNPLNFTLAEWQQCKRLGLDPREVKLVFAESLKRSDNLASFKNAMEEHGYFLAKGDRRGLVALDVEGNVFAVARLANVKTKELKHQLGDPSVLPSVDTVRGVIRHRTTERLRTLMSEHRLQQTNELKPLAEARRQLVSKHRRERTRLDMGQNLRQDRETRARASRFRTGLRGVMDFLLGRKAVLRQQNEAEAYQCHLRDRRQREGLFQAQTKELRGIQTEIEAVRARHHAERRLMARRLSFVWQLQTQASAQMTTMPMKRLRGPQLEL